MIWAPMWVIALIGLALFIFGAFLGRISAGSQQ